MSNKVKWIISGTLMAVLWPIAAVMTILAHDDPSVPPYFAMVRGILAVTLDAIPWVWVAALVASIVEARTRKRAQWMARYAAAPWWVAGVHVFAWIAALAGMQWS
jgi:drug/metabolite transporter (DMT)-like permease